MCVETMDTSSKRMKHDCLRKTTTKPGSKLRWRLLRVPAAEDEALRQCRVTIIRKYLRREHKRLQLPKLTQALGEDTRESRQRERVSEGIPAAACVRRQRPGAMAPENTTQFLMNNVYEDMKAEDSQAAPQETSADLYGERLSPRGVYSALDSGYESCLAFQQRDFEDAFGLCW